MSVAKSCFILRTRPETVSRTARLAPHRISLLVAASSWCRCRCISNHLKGTRELHDRLWRTSQQEPLRARMLCNCEKWAWTTFESWEALFGFWRLEKGFGLTRRTPRFKTPIFQQFQLRVFHAYSDCIRHFSSGHFSYIVDIWILFLVENIHSLIKAQKTLSRSLVLYTSPFGSYETRLACDRLSSSVWHSKTVTRMLLSRTESFLHLKTPQSFINISFRLGALAGKIWTLDRRIKVQHWSSSGICSI